MAESNGVPREAANKVEVEVEFERRREGRPPAIHAVLYHMMSTVLFPDHTSEASGKPLARRIRIALADDVPALREASRQTGHRILLCTRRGSPLRALLVDSIGTIAFLALTGLLVFMLFFLAATINAIIISLLMSMAAVGGVLALFLACVTAVYLGALAIAVFVISTTICTAVLAVLVATGWIGFSGETVIDNSKSVFGNQIKPTMVGDTNIHQTPAISIKSPMQTLEKSGETYSLSTKKTVLAEATSGNVKHGSQITESSLFGSGRSEDPLLIATPSAPLANSHPEKVPDEHPVINKSFPGGSLSFSTQCKSMSSPLESLANSSSNQSSTLSNVPSIKGSSLSEVSSGGSWITSRAATDVSKALTVNFSSSTSSCSVTSRPPPSTSPSTTTSSVQASKNSVPSLASSPPLQLRLENQKPETQLDLPKVSFSAPSEAPPLPTESFTGGSAVKIEASVSSTPSELSSGPISGVQGVSNQMGSPQSTETPNVPPEQPSAGKFSFPTPFSTSNTIQRTESLDVTATQEDEMDEVAPEINEKPDLGLGSLNLGSTPNSTTPKGSPFGVSVGSAATTPTSSPLAMASPSGELFRPASFTFQSPQSSQPSQPPNASAFSGGFGTPTNAQVPTESGFGQPSQIGPGQPALGSVLGTFGQSRRIGSGFGGAGFASSSSIGGGFAAASSTGGFSSSASAGGFAGVGSTGGGFSALASSSGGFGGMASGGGGFAGAASAGGGFGGFAAAASSGAGFAGAAPGGGFSTGAGFGAFGSQQGAGGFSAFGGGGNTKPPELFTQMRK